MKNLDLTISENIKVYGSLTNFLNAMDCTDIEDYKKMIRRTEAHNRTGLLR